MTPEFVGGVALGGLVCQPGSVRVRQVLFLSARREFCFRGAAQGVTTAAMTIRPIFSGYPFQGEFWTVLPRGLECLGLVLSSLFIVLVRVSILIDQWPFLHFFINISLPYNLF